MKVVHVIKRIETIDNDIKELRKLEKSIARDKSFTTPIFMTIEKQINILLGERIKLLELKILNPPDSFTDEDKDIEPEDQDAPLITPEPKKTSKKAAPKKPAETKPAAPAKRKITIPDYDDIPMLTQDQIDAKFQSISKEEEKKVIETALKEPESNDDIPEDDTGIKLLDVALEKGSLNRKVMDREKKVRFFRENFPSD